MKLQVTKKHLFLFAALAIFIAFYFIRFVQLKNTYQPNGTDEFLYYMEAKGISAANQYSTPITFDGVTSKIGHFGIHGWGYAVVDGWLGKIFNAENPSVLISNCIILLLTLIILFRLKQLELEHKIWIALLVLSNHVILRYTFSYYQETIQFTFGLLLSYQLWCIYKKSTAPTTKEIIMYMLTVALLTQFRYNGFLWIFGLLPLISFKHLRVWIIAAIPVFCIYGILSNTLFVAPFPYPEAFNYVFADALKTKPFGELVTWFWSHFVANLADFFLHHESMHKLLMRYLFVGCTALASFMAWRSRDRFTMAVALIALVYFFSTAALSGALYWEYDQRSLAITFCAFIFLLATYKEFKIYLYLALVVQCYICWPVKQECDLTIAQSQLINAPSVDRQKIINDAEGFKSILDNDQQAVLQVPLQLVVFNQPNMLIHFPLVTTSGKRIQYFVNRGYTHPSISIKPKYQVNIGNRVTLTQIFINY